MLKCNERQGMQAQLLQGNIHRHCSLHNLSIFGMEALNHKYNQLTHTQLYDVSNKRIFLPTIRVAV